jgi:hypothetical protein
MRVKVLLWNTGKVKQNLEILLEEARYDLLAVQEPWINQETRSTYCPRSAKYYLVHQLGGRAAIYVSKRFGAGQWEAEMARDWCRVRFPEIDLGAEQERGFELWSVYNPPGGSRLEEAMAGRGMPDSPVVVAGDFNLHHPFWDQYERSHEEAEGLLQLALRWNLNLVTPKGAITRAPKGRQQGRPSTLDLLWATEGLETAYWGGECRGESDHFPQVLEVGPRGTGTPEAAQPPGWAWKKMDRRRVTAEAAFLAERIGLEDQGPAGLRQRTGTVEGLSQAFDWLSEWLVQTADASTPKKKAESGQQAQWWNAGVQEAVREARKAERAAREVPGDHTQQQLNQRLRELSATVKGERTRCWRAVVQKASRKQDLLWTLERWARRRSAAPPDPPKLPDLKGPQGQPDATSHDQKAKALADRFFPSPPAELWDIRDPGMQGEWQPKFWVKQQVTPEDISGALRKAASWKAPGEDLLPVGYLKACGDPLRQVLALLATRCLELGWFPGRFKRAKTVVLQKPGKKPEAYQTAGGYRPIALLPTLGKVIEAVVAGRVSQAAEAEGLLPEEQMGNRAGRSTELAIRLVAAQVQEAWRQRATASLLQLDISGAFDTVNHVRLLATLREAGYPRWLVLWVKAWLTDRKAILCFDGSEAPPVGIRAGVPQGSPLSPILFILYIASLYRLLKQRHPHVSLVGFADDTNLMAFGRDPATNAKQLEKAWRTCLEWAATRGMAFAPEKSELIHFNKGRRQWEQPLQLALPQGGGTSTVRPVGSARFLGVWFDWRLKWKAHLKALQNKLRTQDFALSRIAAKTWGPSLAKAREVYTKCIRAAIAFGASTYHQPTEPGGEPKGIAKNLGKAQNKSLRVVAGAYKATPVRHLETETWVPPIDLYLNKRAADFERRTYPEQWPQKQGQEQEQGQQLRAGLGRVISDACTRVFRLFQKGRRKRGPQGPTAIEQNAVLLRQWVGRHAEQGGGGPDEAVREEWERRWKAGREGRPIVRTADNPTEALFTDLALRRHDGLHKAHSSLLVQARTGDIGLRSFLFRRRVPGVATPYCSCGEGEETVEHLVVWCQAPPCPRRWPPGEISSRRDLDLVLEALEDRTAQLARRVTSWLMDSGLLAEYSLARRLELETGEDEEDE